MWGRLSSVNSSFHDSISLDAKKISLLAATTCSVDTVCMQNNVHKET